MTEGLTRELIALRITRELKDGMYVNLGAGVPGLVSNFIPEGMDIILHSENGILGYGRIIIGEDRDIDLVNASAQPVSLASGASFCDSAESFAMIRGGHIDVAVLGAYQVSEEGDLANWQVSESRLGGVGGAMDLVTGARRIIVAMNHTTPNNEPRIVKKCTMPLTGIKVVNTIITNLALIEVTREGLVLKEVAPGVSPQEVQSLTEPKLILSPDLKEMEL